MKKILPILSVLGLLASSCVNPLEFRADQAPELLVMNAMLRTDMTEHSVWLSLSTVDDAMPLEEAALHCYLNGKPAAEGVYIPEKIDEFYYSNHKSFCASRYDFSLEIHPGDEVRLEATYGDLRASATVKVPQAASLAPVDTVRIERSLYYAYAGYNVSSLGCNLHIQDQPGQDNWYRILATYDGKAFGYEDGRRDIRNVWFEFTRDPILMDGNPTLQELDFSMAGVLTNLLSENIYCTFRDKPFADGRADVQIEIFDGSVYDYYEAFEVDRSERDRHLYIDLLTITKEEYDYLNQLNNDVSHEAGGPLFQEPVHMPVNVEGGMGFVSVAAVSRQELVLAN
ncbi:MAG: DUF4249 domain-containing protein [Bacteroidales bacterium]|nr:DUF4249 domain-containing protein [Bacteroidales bacterium]